MGRIVILKRIIFGPLERLGGKLQQENFLRKFQGLVVLSIGYMDSHT